MGQAAHSPPTFTRQTDTGEQDTHIQKFTGRPRGRAGRGSGDSVRESVLLLLSALASRLPSSRGSQSPSPDSTQYRDQKGDGQRSQPGGPQAWDPPALPPGPGVTAQAWPPARLLLPTVDDARRVAGSGSGGLGDSLFPSPGLGCSLPGTHLCTKRLKLPKEHRLKSQHE